MKSSMEERRKIGRRTLLKAIAATSGAVAAATMLPGKWVKPVIEAGVLPVHAQASRAAITLANLVLSPVFNQPAKTKQIPLPFLATFNYADPAAGVNNSSLLYAWQDGVPLAKSGSAIPSWPGSVTPQNATSGSIEFTFELNDYPQKDPEICVQIVLGGRTSNKICGILSVPR